MTLRAKLALAFAAFAAVPLALALVPVSRALSRALASEATARLERAAAAVEGEIARLGAGAAGAVVELAAAPEAEAFAGELAAGTLAPAEAALRAAEWQAARPLDLVAVLDAEGRVLSSAHLPGRAGDRDPELAPLASEVPPGRADARLVTRAGPAGLERVPALVAWSPAAGDPALRVVGGIALDAERAERLAALTGAEVALVLADGAVAATGAPPGAAPDRRRLLTAPPGALRAIPLGPAAEPIARVELSLADEGLARAQATVLLVFLAALGAGTLAAAAVGGVLAARVTRPVEALRRAAARVAAGDLSARVAVPAAGELGELVRAFDAMTRDLEAGRARLAQAERVAAWREVARRLAHEIKNPLTPVAMSVETLRDARARGHPAFDEIFLESTQAISEEVRRLKRIVDEFSRFARLPAPERAPVAPDDLVSSVLALFPAPPAGVAIRREVAAGLPAVLADRDQVLQVLLNLVANALDAVAAGGTVAITARREGGHVAIAIADTGPGIAEADLPRVFEPYFTTKEGGTGLGLAIAQRIAEEHGGGLEAASRPGEGATFTLRLPVAAPGPGGEPGGAGPPRGT